MSYLSNLFDRNIDLIYFGDMNDRDMNIIEAAFRLFAHYGVGKTSMTEIASASGVARQTVYNAFDSKEDLIFAALLHYAGKSRDDVERDCAAVVDPAERLDVMFRHLAAIPFEGMQTLPHLDEILEVGANLSDDRKARIIDTYKVAIRIVLAPYEDRLAERGIDPAKLSTFLKGMLTYLKREARDHEHLRELYGPARAMLITCMGDRTALPTD